MSTERSLHYLRVQNKLTRKQLIDCIQEVRTSRTRRMEMAHSHGTIQVVPGECDFLYLRFDFQNQCNVAYAFVNFTSGMGKSYPGIMIPRANFILVSSVCFVSIRQSATGTKVGRVLE